MESDILTTKQIIVALANKYEGDWAVIYKVISKREDLDTLSDWCDKSKDTDQITLLDPEYPKTLKGGYQPPFVLFYKGDISLLADSNTKLCVSAGREIDPLLLNKALEDISQLPKDIVIVTQVSDIIHTAIKTGHKVIVTLPCGYNMYWSVCNAETRKLVLQNGGLVITTYPDYHAPDPTSMIIKTQLQSGLSNAILIVDAKPKSSTNTVVTFALQQPGNTSIMAYPTLPGENKINNSLIKQGATLVENVEDILLELGKGEQL